MGLPNNLERSKMNLSKNIIFSTVDELVKSQKVRFPVIPANPGSSPGQAPESSYFKYLKIFWTPVFGELSRAVSTGVTTFCETITVDDLVKSTQIRTQFRKSPLAPL
jgi:hypothetical protein